MKSVLVIRCMALIVPLGAFINQLHPNPQLYYYKKKSRNSAMTKQSWRERERRGGDEKVMYSITLLKKDLDNR